MTQKEQQKIADGIMRLLKVRYVQFPIALTEKGPLTVKYIKDQEPQYVLDSVPLDLKDYNNRELTLLLEKYLYETPLS